MKTSYNKVSVRCLEMIPDQVVLTGSLTDSKIVVEKEDVKVVEFMEDNAFIVNGFGDITL